jgi:3-methyladenine DNA glycosylase AlkD
MTGPEPEAALAALRGLGDPTKAAEMAAYHKTGREIFGVSNPAIDALVKGWREAGMTVPERVALARALWDSGAFEARLAAARLLTQARIPEDAAVWETILAWLPDFDGWAIADHVAKAGERRLVAEPSRLDEVEGWTAPDRPLWTRRAALVFTLPWSKLNHPSPEDLARRERILGWAAAYSGARDRRLRKAVSWWLRSLSKHDPERVRAFLAEHGDALGPAFRNDAARRLGPAAD